MTVQNARIARTQLGYEDHGILTAWVHLDYGDAGQRYGGYALDAPARPSATGREATVFAGSAIAGILKATGVSSWEKLPGTPVRVRMDGGEWGTISAIGHFLEDRWYSFAEDAKAQKDAVA